MQTIMNYNGTLIEVKRHLQEDSLSKYWLINEAFILWYTIIEDIECENFEEDERIEMLRKNFDYYKRYYSDDPDYSFIFGWIASVSPWYLDKSMTEDIGKSLLISAYKKSVRNKLFRWSVREELGTTNKETEHLKIDILSRFNFFFDYGKLIEEYFEDIVRGSS